MRCERARDQFSAYIEGTASDAIVVTLESHLSACETCRKEVADLKVAWQALGDLKQLDPPADLTATIWKRIDELEAAAARPQRPIWLALLSRRALSLAAAGIILAMLAGFRAPIQATLAGFFQPQPVSTNEAVVLGEVRMNGDRAVVSITNRSAVELTVRAALEDASGAQSPGTTANLQVGRATDVTVVASGIGHPERLRVTWSRNGAIESRSVAVKAP